MERGVSAGIWVLLIGAVIAALGYIALRGALSRDGVSVFRAQTQTSSTGGDTTPPTIANFTVSNITTNSAAISWDTDEPSTSQVYYQIFSKAGLCSQQSTVQTIGHRVVLTGLVPATSYQVRVRSRDEAGNLGKHPLASYELFTTLP